MIYGRHVLHDLISVVGAGFRRLALFNKMKQVLTRGKVFLSLRGQKVGVRAVMSHCV